MKIQYHFLLLLIFLGACSGQVGKKETKSTEEISTVTQQKDSFPAGEVIPSVNIKDNGSGSFALYLPHQYNQNQHLPALIFLDPHGDGSFPLDRYKGLAEKFGVVLVGSNDSKNGVTFDQTNLIVTSLYSEISSRLKIDTKQISIAGFSGGAKVALVAASQLPSLLSVVYCGAGLPQLPPQLPSALAIAGLKDMNYTDVIATDQQLESMHLRHALITWNGKHEWSDSLTFQNAFFWILFRAIEKKISAADNNLVNEFISQNKKTFTDPVQEEYRLKKLAYFLNGVQDISHENDLLISLQSKSTYHTAIAKQKNDLELESRMKENYMQCITLKDPLWWRDEVNHMRASGPNPMNDRILGYISLACYSYSNNALKSKDISAAEKYLAIYAIADRDNADRAYMQACLYGLMQNKEGALQSIADAINFGFKDKSKLQSETALSFINNTAEFNELVRKIK